MTRSPLLHALRASLVAGALAGLAACAARAPMRPSGSAMPDPSATAAFAEATSRCSGLRSLTTELALSGKAGADRLRGRLHAGFAAPASLRLEGVAPFGPPVFILAGRDDRATLYLPREQRTLPSADVAGILERLTGVGLGAADLRVILTACLSDEPQPSEGRTWPGGWKAVTLAPERVAYLRQTPAGWTVAAADFGPWTVDYGEHQAGQPRVVRLRLADRGIDLTARIGQTVANPDLAEAAFRVDVPAGTAAITLDDLRGVTPLRGGR